MKSTGNVLLSRVSEDSGGGGSNGASNGVDDGPAVVAACPPRRMSGVVEASMVAPGALSAIGAVSFSGVKRKKPGLSWSIFRLTATRPSELVRKGGTIGRVY